MPKDSRRLQPLIELSRKELSCQLCRRPPRMLLPLAARESPACSRSLLPDRCIAQRCTRLTQATVRRQLVQSRQLEAILAKVSEQAEIPLATLRSILEGFGEQLADVDAGDH